MDVCGPEFVMQTGVFFDGQLFEKVGGTDPPMVGYQSKFYLAVNQAF
jgi:hypothetical protein